MLTREQQFVHNGVNFTVTERFTPTDLAAAVDGQGERSLARQMAMDLYEIGNASFTLVADRPTPDRYNLDFRLDFNRNREVCRDVALIGMHNRLGAFFGIVLTPPAGPEVREQITDDGLAGDAGPPCSLLGDLARGTGFVCGLLCDYLMAGVWYCCGKVADFYAWAFQARIAAEAS